MSDKNLLIFLKGLGYTQPFVKKVAGIDTKKYHDIGKGNEVFTCDERDKLKIVIEELKEVI